MIIDLSPSMQERVTEWQRLGHQLDVTLLYQCGYYPRGGCQDCSFDSPNDRCKQSHILIDTRINPPLLNLKSKKQSKGKVNFETLLSRLPEEAREAVRRIPEGR